MSTLQLDTSSTFEQLKTVRALARARPTSPGESSGTRASTLDRPALVLRLDRNGEVLGPETRSPTFVGYSTIEMAHRRIESFFVKRSSPVVLEMMARFGVGQPRIPYIKCAETLWAKRKDQFEIPVSMALAPFGASHVVMCLRELTVDWTAEQSASVLSEARSALAASLDYQAILETTVSFAAQRLADYAIVQTTEKGAGSAVMRTAAADSVDTLIARRLEDHWQSSPLAALSQRVIQTGVPLFLSEAADLGPLGIASLHPRTLIVAPLGVGTNALGALILISKRFEGLVPSLAVEFARTATRALENAQRLDLAESSAKRRQQLMQVVAHELGNAVGVLKLWSQVRQTSATAPDPSKATDTAFARISRLLADLRAGAIDTGGLAVKPTDSLSPASLVTAAAETAQRAAGDRRVGVETAPGLPAVRADEVRVLQVLTNLVDNAIKFSPARATVTVGARPAGERVTSSSSSAIPVLESPRPISHAYSRAVFKS